MNWMQFCYRNLVLNRRRTLMALTLVAFSSISILLSGGFVSFSYSALADGMIRSGTGHVQVARPHYFSSLGGLSEQILDEEIQKELEAVFNRSEGIQYFIRNIELEGLVSRGSTTKSVIVEATDIDKRIRLASIFSPITKGSIPINTEENPFQAMLGDVLAQNLGVDIGDTIVLLISTFDGGINAVDVEVKALLSTGIPDIDLRTVLIPQEILPILLGESSVSSYILVTDKNEASLPLYREMQEKLVSLPEIEVKHWKDIAIYYKQVEALYNVIFSFFFIMMGVILFIGINNIMATTVLERMREAGTMRSFGFKIKRIRLNFLIEGVMIGVVGLATSLVLAHILTLIVNNLGIMMPAPPGLSREYPFAINISLSVTLIDTVIILVSCMIASYIPSKKVGTLSVIDLINHS